MLRFQLIPIHPLAVLKNGIAGVKIQLLGAGAELQHHVQIGHQLLRGSGPARIVGGGLDASGEGLGGVGIETTNVVALPAVQRNGNILQLCDGGIGIDTKCDIFGFCFCVRHII